MRIALFTDGYAPNISGVVTSIDMLAKGLRQMGHEVYIVTSSYKHNKSPKEKYIIRLKGFNVPFKSFKGYQLVRNKKKYQNLLKSYNFDVIHVHTEFGIGRIGLRLAKKLNIPMIFTTHTMYEDYMHHVIRFGGFILKRPFMNYVKKILGWFVRESTYTIAPNQKVIDMYARYGIEKDFKLIPTGLDLDKFKKENFSTSEVDELKKSLGLNDEIVILSIGRIAKEKSIDMIIREFSKNNLEGKCKLVIVGDGPSKKELMDLVDDLHISDKVIFTGAVPWEKIGLYYQLGDVFVNASVSETQGLTYIEALAASLPVIVRYDTNLEEFIKDHYNGLFYKTEEEFGKRLKELMYDKKLRDELIKNAPISVQRYSVLQYSKNVLKLYMDATKKA